MKAPAEMVRRLQAIRPSATLVCSRRGIWMLGEVRPTAARYERGTQILAQYQANADAMGREYADDDRSLGLLEEAYLLMQGFVWIRDYPQVTGEIVEDYRRMCWKERNGLLDGEFRQMADASDGKHSLLRRIKIAVDRMQAEAASDFRILARRRKTVSFDSRRAANAHGLFVPPTARVTRIKGRKTRRR